MLFIVKLNYTISIYIDRIYTIHMISYNRCNVTKKEMMEGAFDFYPSAFTAISLAEKIGHDAKKIGILLRYYHKHHYGYFRRLKVKDGRRYRYTLTKKGTIALLQYRRRMAFGFDLNCRNRVPKRVDGYTYTVPEVSTEAV